MDSSFEAPGHFQESVSFLPSFAKIVVSSDVLIHFAEAVSPEFVGASWRSIEQ
jgi:hypothetical protein